ncbi:hypothetical protein [Allopusillimonas ginsengisoli]|uniref:hypothetical protein n=1 Tax=Allopusillimonas ginsengisoli TaxID=453575 RepID=UPI00101F993F|nr:hypothetical protein [Allopusillimonas ginsengisoli]TEA78629.1 hypothetical protein ERE07_09540 [Allopusillimonas ginsengisoli]
MSIRAQLAALALALLALAGWWLHHSGYRQGVADQKAKTVLQQIAIEQGMQYERDQADAQYRGAVLAREAAQKDVASVRARLDGLLRERSDNAKTAHASSRSDDAGADGIGILIECVQEYDYMGREAARLADKVGGLQGYVRSVQTKK